MSEFTSFNIGVGALNRESVKRTCLELSVTILQNAARNGNHQSRCWEDNIVVFYQRLLKIAQYAFDKDLLWEFNRTLEFTAAAAQGGKWITADENNLETVFEAVFKSVVETSATF